MNYKKIFIEPEKTYIHMERYVNDGSPSGFSKNTTSEKTKPTGNYESFPLSIIQFDESIKVVCVGSSKYDNLQNNCIFCHPDNLSQNIMLKNKKHWKEIGQVIVAPTASGRTVKCLEGEKYFIKLDYIGMLGRIPRNLDFQRVQSACEVTNIIKDAIMDGKMNHRFSLLLEDCGRVAYLPNGDGTYYEMGYVIRDSKPFCKEQDSESLFLVPMFSLFYEDKNSLNDKPLLIQFFENQTKDVHEYLFDDVIAPLINVYFDTLEHCGLCLEAHSQNMLVAIDKQCHIKYIVARDMESVDKDLPLREFLGLSNNQIKATKYKCLRKSDYNYQIKHSFMYDFKLGKYTLSPILDLFKKKYANFDEKIILNKIKELVNLRAKDLPKDYFPNVWYDYDDIVHNQKEKRPYRAHEDLRYR